MEVALRHSVSRPFRKKSAELFSLGDPPPIFFGGLRKRLKIAFQVNLWMWKRGSNGGIRRALQGEARRLVLGDKVLHEVHDRCDGVQT